MYALFGPSGNPDAFYEQGYKTSAEMPKWLSKIGLNAYEYSCSRGVNIKEATARIIGAQAKEHNIALSIHAPYYINLATLDDKIRENTKNHFRKCLEAANQMEADRIVFHIGGVGKQERSRAYQRAKQLFSEVLDECVKRGLQHIQLCPETMGKKNQLGSLEEVIDLSKMAEWVKPAVDFGHLHAITQGKYTTYEEFQQTFEIIAGKLGEDTARNLHIHFSKIEFSAGGEKKHWTFADNYGPDHIPLLRYIADKGFTPRIICESLGTQALDAKIMQDYYFSLVNI